MTAILDDFNTGASQALSARAGWGTGHWSGSLDLKTDATPTKATTSLGVPAGNIWAANFTADHEVMFTYATVATVQLLARVNSTSAPSAGYVGYIASGNQEIQTRAGATLATGSVLTPAAGDSFRMGSVGSTITLDSMVSGAGSWTNIYSITDTTYTAGTFIGIHVTSGAPEIDAFGGGTAVATTTTHRFMLLGVGA